MSDIFFTSGTTGRSKGVVCSHRQSLAATAAVWQAIGGLRASDRYLCVNPFFHTFGYRFGIVACLQAGATLVTFAGFDPAQALATIAQQRITVFPGPPVIYRMLLEHRARQHYDLTSWRLAVTGSTTLPVTLIDRMQRELEVDVVTGYGLTEASGYGTTCRVGDDPVTVATTCGRPIPGLELRIEMPDDNGAGEVLLRGSHVMSGYLGEPQATAEAIDADGWLHTGDIGILDDSGDLRITGRIKDMYICGGFNVYPAEVEQELARLDGVIEVAVIGIPDERLGEVGRAFVVAAAESELDKRAVIAYGRGRLAEFKLPRSVVFVSELPRNASGKVLKTRLREFAVPAEWTTAAVPIGSGGPPVGSLEHWIAELWQALLGIERPGRHDRFTDLGGDSVRAAEFCAAVGRQFGVTLTIDGFAARQTIAGVVAALAPGSRRGRESAVTLRADGEGPVCLVTPGVGGHAWCYSRLAAALPGPCDVLAVSPMDISRDARDHLRHAIRASAHAAVADRATAGRPLLLIGYSFGALMAADLACWLDQQSVPVSGLFLLDPVPVDSRLRRRTPGAVFTGLRDRRSARRRSAPATLSPAAQNLENDIAAMADLLTTAYLDGSIRLPPLPVACLRSRESARTHRSASALFGTPLTQIDTTLTDLGHLEMVQSVRGVSELADWLSARMEAMTPVRYPNRTDVPGVNAATLPRNSISIGG